MAIIKIKYLILLTVTAFVSCKSEKDQNNFIENNDDFLNKDLQKNNLNGKVKSVNKYFIDTNEIRTEYYWYKEFNDKGILVKSEDNRLDYSNLIITCDSNDIPINGIQYFKTSYFDYKEDTYNYKYKYNLQGLRTKESYKSEQEETIDYDLHYRYNKAGFETSKRLFKKETPVSLDSTVYDKKNRIIKQLHLQPDTNQFYRQIITVYSNNSKKETHTLHRMPCSSSYAPEYQFEKLDNCGNPLTIIRIRDDDTLYSLKFKYKYDLYNNWIERVSYDKDSIVGIGRRDIIYY